MKYQINKIKIQIHLKHANIQFCSIVNDKANLIYIHTKIFIFNYLAII